MFPCLRRPGPRVRRRPGRSRHRPANAGSPVDTAAERRPRPGCARPGDLGWSRDAPRAV